MPETRIDSESTAPYGTEPCRKPWPLYLFGVLFVVWVAFLIVMAILYPAR